MRHHRPVSLFGRLRGLWRRLTDVSQREEPQRPLPTSVHGCVFRLPTGALAAGILVDSGGRLWMRVGEPWHMTIEASPSEARRVPDLYRANGPWDWN